ncbi:MAG: hypothetical protein ACI4IE_06520, partial [Eubacterium sp.]
NQRTKEVRYYNKGGAMEISAMESAQDAVQNYGYNATFPILLDIEGQPSYFMSLYGDGYTVKGYALVNLDDKTIVGTGLLDVAKSDAKALNSAVENYIDALKDKGKVSSNANAEDYKVEEGSSSNQQSNTEPNTTEAEVATDTDSKAGTVTGEITDIKTSVNDGNTVYYLQIDGKKYYYIPAGDCMEVLLMQKGDRITVTYDKDSSSQFVKASSVDQVK